MVLWKRRIEEKQSSFLWWKKKDPGTEKKIGARHWFGKWAPGGWHAHGGRTNTCPTVHYEDQSVRQARRRRKMVLLRSRRVCVWGNSSESSGGSIPQQAALVCTEAASRSEPHLGVSIKLPGPNNILHALENLLKFRMILQVSWSSVNNQQPFFQSDLSFLLSPRY